MKKIGFILALLLTHTSQAVVYSDHEINQELTSPELQRVSKQFITEYYTSANPQQTIDALMTADKSPIQREYILFNLLTEISQYPPQDYHHYVVNLMKTHQAKAEKKHDEGHVSVPVFNLTSKAHGIENIWLAYRTEQQFNQLFEHNISTAIVRIKDIIAQKNRPQWHGVKRSIDALSHSNKEALVELLIQNTQPNTGFDQLISHVGLISGNLQLIEQSLLSEQRKIRENTLRKLSNHLTQNQAKSLLLNSAIHTSDMKMSTSLLSQYSDDSEVQNFLIGQLNHKDLAEHAAFALSHSNDLQLPQLLKEHYLQTTQATVKNHILLALKLNGSPESTLALDDLKQHIKTKSKGGKWLKSFNGEQP